MTPASSPPVDVAVAALAAARPLCVFLDIDGTLAPIAPRPEDARIPAATLSVLEMLAGRPHTHLALVTGRALADAAHLAPVARAWLVGNHGAERRAPGGHTHVDPRVVPFAGALRAAARELLPLAGAVPGVQVENKKWSLSVHYRQAPRLAVPVVVDAAREAAARAGLRVGAGKEVVELKAPVDLDKGTAALALMAEWRADGAPTLAAGDDVTDEDLFARLRAVAPHAVTVRVGGPGVPTAAEYGVADPEALRRLLSPLVASRRAGESAY